ncbi:MAG: hypothetical protein K0U41_08900 [Gammaproteobacteria bacterium]|nr:hypothetical protein [Gammaproteobacteria bacterium]
MPSEIEQRLAKVEMRADGQRTDIDAALNGVHNNETRGFVALERCEELEDELKMLKEEYAAQAHLNNKFIARICELEEAHNDLERRLERAGL